MQYVYAIVPASATGLPAGPGIDGREIEPIRLDTVAALASAVRTERVRPSRANLSAHQGVVSEAHGRSPVLPVRFGTVMRDRRSVREELLEPGRPRFERMLAEFEGKDEFRLKGRYLPEVALREVVEGSGIIARLRERVRAAGRSARPGDQIRLGELVAAGLERLCQRDAAAVLGALSPHVAAWESINVIRQSESHLGRIDAGTRMISRSSDDVPFYAALLVERVRVPDLDATLEKIAADQRGRMELELVGPLPPWDFSAVSAGAA